LAALAMLADEDDDGEALTDLDDDTALPVN
jgi:hypothetical protein